MGLALMGMPVSRSSWSLWRMLESGGCGAPENAYGHRRGFSFLARLTRPFSRATSLSGLALMRARCLSASTRRRSALAIIAIWGGWLMVSLLTIGHARLASWSPGHGSISGRIVTEQSFNLGETFF
jgi:hypothetical protein